MLRLDVEKLIFLPSQLALKKKKKLPLKPLPISSEDCSPNSGKADNSA